MATFDFTMDFRVFDDEWTVVPIIDAQVLSICLLIGQPLYKCVAESNKSLGLHRLLIQQVMTIVGVMSCWIQQSM